ncbi:NPCBM/NEW2 domain protein [Aquisphaera giovannonii]|uniref:NPCBM/NEW2 domain protein n=1 Tax=Aquisphaera giovannonii TaxID=406548 RepID=A0A5B9W1K9_9BACT|nr:NPCBM/NEW2 domain-containing protein [Aquisphaera giovannonii]QEH34114.1 NPCBM/NEW2 domain protein [Aquisphaera giovannonii]
MLGGLVVWIGLWAAGAGDYHRPLAEKAFDQAALDAEGFGDKKALAREADGLRVTLKPGEAEAGWKTPQQLRIGGDCTITATLDIRKLPKPAREDGAAIGIAVATQVIDQPEATLLRELEPDGRDIYRPIEKSAAGGAMMGSPMMGRRRVFNPFGGPDPTPAKPIRHTFPAKGQSIRLELRRQGQSLRFQVYDEMAKEPREIGKVDIGPMDIGGVKLFVANRNGAEPVDVLFRDLIVHADRITGLGTAVRTIHGTVLHGEPTALEHGKLVIMDNTPAAPPANPPAAGTADLPRQVFTPVRAAPTRLPSGGVVAELPRLVFVSNPGPQTNPAARVKARLPLDQVESITFERSSMLAVKFVGQPNVDTTGPGGTPGKDDKKAAGDDLAAPPPGTVPPPKMPKVEPKPSGIRDIHLVMSGLRDAAIQQIMIQCPTDKGQAMWQLDTTGTPAWPVSLRRAGKETWADLFLEPPDGDLNNKQFMINLMYADGQNAQVQAQATGKTDPKLKFDPAAPTPALDARVYLAEDEQLFGKLEALSADALTLTTTWGDKVDVPLARVLGVYMGMADHKETPESFAKRLKAPGGEDLLLARAKDGEVVTIGGVVEAAKGEKLTFAYRGKSRTLALKQVEGFVLAAKPAPAPPTDVRPTFTLSGGLTLSGRWVKVEGDKWEVETPWGQAVKLPAAEVRGVRFRGGEMAYLSDLQPSKVEETPYFARRTPYRRDVTLDGSPLKLDDRAVEKGLSVHSRTALTYDLDRRYTTFEATVGFDPSANKKGRVDCRVFADGKELYANPDLRADAPPVRLSLPVAGADQLRLVVDFGADEDTGDRVIWADARLYRPGAAPAPGAASVAATSTDRSPTTTTASRP